jgi:hypothetical protein
MRNRPEVMSLLDLVDYFVSHPTASTWWRSIFDSYIASDGEKVHADILAATRRAAAGRLRGSEMSARARRRRRWDVAPRHDSAEPVTRKSFPYCHTGPAAE